MGETDQIEALAAKMAETMTPKLNAMIAPALQQARSQAIDDCIKVATEYPLFVLSSEIAARFESLKLMPSPQETEK